jgi:hypothetical protein
MGIISIALCWCYGVVGITLGIISLVLASKSKKLYKAEPEKYTLGSYKNLMPDIFVQLLVYHYLLYI